MKVAVIGAGLIGGRRARVAAAFPGTTVVLVVDVDSRRAEHVADQLGCESGTDWRAAVQRRDVDCVVVATPNNLLAPVSTAALGTGKHVLCEKPMATRIEDAESMADVARRGSVVLKIGYTLRHHPAIVKARELIASGMVGKPMMVKGCYGHGGRPGYEKEWRCMPDVAGGGILIDQGVHLIDLSRWFLGEFAEVVGMVTTSFWDIAPLEDNALAILKTHDGKMASLHASLTQWKNRFVFEITGEKGYCVVEGLGGSYGQERLVLGIRDVMNPPPKEETFTFGGDEIAWQNEWKDFFEAIQLHREPLAGGEDGLQALRIAQAIYRSAELKKTVKMK